MFCGFCFQPRVMYQKFRLVIKIFLIWGIRMACFCIFTEQLWWVCTKHLHFVLYWTNMYTCWYFPSQKMPESHTSVSKIQPPPTPFSLMRDCHLVEHRRHFWFGLRQNCVIVIAQVSKERKRSRSVFVTPWTVAHQAPPSVGFSRQEYWSGFPFPSPGDLPDPGIEPWSPAL